MIPQPATVMMQPVYQYVPQQQHQQPPQGNRGIFNKMRQTKQQMRMGGGAQAPIESRVLLPNGRSVNQQRGQQSFAVPIEQRVTRALRTPQQQQSQGLF